MGLSKDQQRCSGGSGGGGVASCGSDNANPPANQNDLCGPCCDPCAPCEPCEPCVCQEPVYRDYDICGPEACRIFGHLDVDHVPDLIPKAVLKRNHYPLGVSVGIVHSTDFVYTNLEDETNKQLKFATILKAFAQIYILDEKKWSNEVVDNILKEGQQLYQDSEDYEPDPEEDNNILAYSKYERKIKREFDIEGYIFQIELGQKFYLNQEMNLEIMEKWNRFYTKKPPNPFNEFDLEEMMEEIEEEEDEEPDPDLDYGSFKSHIIEFFKKNQHGLIQINDSRYILVWKEYGSFFVLDFTGRRLNDLHTDLRNGFAVFLLLKTIKNLIHLIKNLSDFYIADTYSLREIKVVRVTGPDGRTYTIDYGFRKNQWEIINFDYAFLRANLHLSMNRANVIRNRSALPVGIAAILASKIDHPALWNKKVMDRIICYGLNICQKCWLACAQRDKPIVLAEFPRNLKMGQFWIRYDLYPMKYEGVFKCVPNQENNDLALLIQRAFDAGDTHLLLQASNQMYALWKKRNGFFYLFDPFRHRIIGNPPKPNEDPKSATLRMSCIFDKFIKILSHILSQYTKHARIYLHVVKIREIKKHQDEREIACDSSEENANPCPEPEEEEEEDNDLDDIKTLNEEICFEEDPLKCIAEISDFEEEEEEIPISEYEEEVAPGEEEEAMVEELHFGEVGKDGKRKRRKKKKKKKKKKIREVHEHTQEEHAKKEKKKKEKKKKKPPPPPPPPPVKVETKEKECPKVEGGKAKKLLDRYLEQARCLAEEFSLRDKKETTCSQDPDHKMPPAYGEIAYDMVVVGSESGSFSSICKLLRNGFKHADRIYLMTPWANYVAFRAWNLTEKVYFLFDGCTCNINRFRYLDLTSGTTGLLSFTSLSDMVSYIMDSCTMKCSIKSNRDQMLEQICNQYGV